MRIARILLLPALLLLCGADEPEASLTTSSTTPMGLTLRVSVPTRQQPGKPIVAKVKVVNDSTRCLNWMVGPAIRYQVTTWDGKKVPLTAWARNDGTDNHPMRLMPFKRIVDQRELTKWYELKNSNGYVLTVSVPFFSDDDKQMWGEAKVILPFFVGDPPFPVKPDEGGI